MGKPGRSDELLSEEEQMQLEQKVRQYFEDAQPKRPRKPERSDPTAFDDLHDLPPSAADAIPELIRFQELKSKSSPLAVGGGVVSGDDYEETHYYEDLTVVEGGEHHTTGSGYIVTEASNNDSLQFEWTGTKLASKTRFKCNPATNEWEPSHDPVFGASTKPSRSDP